MRNKQLLQSKGPLLLTANHPNTLMDAVVIGALFKQPVHFLTRGDMFNTNWKRKLLAMLNMIPIYRIRDGYPNLHLNQYAFDKSHEVLSNNGIVLIFIEGVCKHTHELQPFKKGAARIAFRCWKENIPLQVMPMSIRYNSLFNFGKNILLNIAAAISQKQLTLENDDAKNYLHFNSVVREKLNILLNEKTPENPQPIFVLLAAGMVGSVIHAPFFYPLKTFVKKQTNNNEFYDSVLFGLLFLLYPIYVLVVSLLIFLFTQNFVIAILVFCVFPFTAWCAVRNKA